MMTSMHEKCFFILLDCKQFLVVELYKSLLCFPWSPKEMFSLMDINQIL